MPEWKPEILRRLAPLRLAPTREAEIADELAQHLEDRYQELLALGVSDEEASSIAIEELEGEDLLARGLRLVERDLSREPVTRQFFLQHCSGYSLCPPYAAQVSWLHPRRRAHAGAGDRREHCHF
jgi:hypothetical protein